REQHIVYMTSLTNSISTLLTDGNPHGHLILRGGREPNYGLSDITKAVKLMHDEGINHRLIIDCSHGNSGKVAKRQISVARQVIDNRKKIPGYVAGIMVESFLQDGKQSDSFPLEYGQSVTDECISWQQTEQLLSTLAAQL
ncbi:TPA: 3-deoxy-7-phosphoheptulonate synthase, partial [Escherichia coli]